MKKPNNCFHQTLLCNAGEANVKGVPMKRLFCFLFFSLFFSPAQITYQREIDEINASPELTIYQIAALETLCPAWILRGLHYAESSYGKNLKHPNRLDRGPFGLNELFRAEREKKCGKYNADCPLQSAIIAGHIIMENYRLLGDMDAAISAYCHGVGGTRSRGARLEWLIAKCLGYKVRYER